MLGDNIRENREKLGMNQVELAKKLGVSKQTVSNWENDNRTPSAETLNVLANIFNVSIDSLLGRIVSNVKNDIELEKHLETAKEINELNKEDQEFILEMIKKLKRNKEDK